MLSGAVCRSFVLKRAHLRIDLDIILQSCSAELMFSTTADAQTEADPGSRLCRMQATGSPERWAYIAHHFNSLNLTV